MTDKTAVTDDSVRVIGPLDDYRINAAIEDIKKVFGLTSDAAVKREVLADLRREAKVRVILKRLIGLATDEEVRAVMAIPDYDDDPTTEAVEGNS